MEGRGGSRQMREYYIRLFQFDDIGQVFHGHIGTQVDCLNPARFKKVMHEENSQLMVFTFGQEE